MGTLLTEKNAQWRHDAVNEALRGFDNDEQDDALLREVRRYLPGCATEKIWPNRARLLCFFQEETEGCNSLLASCMTNYGENDPNVYLAWYEVIWQGERVEVALSPGYSTSAAICIGQNADVLHRFADAVTEFADRPLGRCLRYTEGWENATDLDDEIGRTTWSDIVLPPSLIGAIRDSVEGFVASREAFSDLGFAWKRGILLIGPPGTGKTMVFKAIASSLPDLPLLYVRDLEENCAKRESIKTIFERARKLAPCILTFEDMDGLITENNRTQFLNEMDGFESNEGLLIIASSNHPGKIDEALLKRPSRFDRVFHIGLPPLDERIEYCWRVLTRPTLNRRYASGFDPRATASLIGERTRASLRPT